MYMYENVGTYLHKVHHRWIFSDKVRTVLKELPLRENWHWLVLKYVL